MAIDPVEIGARAIYAAFARRHDAKSRWDEGRVPPEVKKQFCEEMQAVIRDLRSHNLSILRSA